MLYGIKNLGFKDQGSLFLLQDVEKIMFLLTDKLTDLKKIAQVYYSEDFKKLYVKSLGSLGLSLSQDESCIHMNINLENVSDEELIGLIEAIKENKKYYRLRNGSIINLASVESEKLSGLIRSLDIDKSSVEDGIFQIPLNKCIYMENYLREKGIEVQMDEKLGKLVREISNPKEGEFVIEPSLEGVLRDYQKTGVRWLKGIAQYCFGGILADDMGLGKTLQVLAFIASENRELPCIVVAPTSIIYNWKLETEKFTPFLKVIVITGGSKKRAGEILRANEYDILITSYNALKNDVENYKNVKFSYIFLDEAQNIKNPLTLNANSVKSLKGKSCFALTGTPLKIN